MERDPRAARVIAENLRRTRLAGGTVIRRDALRFLADGPADVPGSPFGAAILDPPYAEPAALEAALERLGDAGLGWLREDAVIVAKHFWRDAPPGRAGNLLLERMRRFGETALSFYRRQPDAAPELPAIPGELEAIP